MKTFGTVCCPVSLSRTFCTCGPWGPEGQKKPKKNNWNVNKNIVEQQDKHYQEKTDKQAKSYELVWKNKC